jgi:hypothetical protein
VLLGRVVGVTVLAILVVVCLPWTKVYSLHAREVECNGKGKAHRPYEFGVKGERRHHGETFRRRAVRHPCRSTARQSL